MTEKEERQARNLVAFDLLRIVSESEKAEYTKSEIIKLFFEYGKGADM